MHASPARAMLSAAIILLALVPALPGAAATPPTPTSIEPGSGGEGTFVTVTGTAMLTVATAYVYGPYGPQGSYHLVEHTIVSDSEITFTMPALAPGTYDVEVRNSAEEFAYVCCFEYTGSTGGELTIESLSPTIAQPGDIIHVSGTGFANLTLVEVCNAGSCFGPFYSVINDTAFNFTVPPTPGENDLRVDDAAGNTDSYCCFTVLGPDNDGDGFTQPEDCDDADSSVFPGATEVPNDGIDQDCNGEDWIDADLDGYPSAVDCNDTDSSIHPGATDVPGDGIDQDCTGRDRPVGDEDGDEYAPPEDCDDADPGAFPGMPDTPYDGVDQDCDGVDARLPQFSAWLQLYGSQDLAQDDAFFGVVDGTSDSFDEGVDTPEPPAPPDGYGLRAYFHYPGNAAGTQELSTSYTGHGATVVFPLRVEWQLPTEGAREFELYWSDAFDLPPEFSVLLRDGNTILDMELAPMPYVISAASATGARDMQIIVTTAVFETMSLRAGWSLVSVPMDLFEPDSASVFAGVADVVLGWDGAAYVPAAEIHAGVGYWVHNYQGGAADISLFGAPVYSLDVELQPGWNLIGGPVDGADLWDAPPSVSRTGFQWNGAGYVATSFVAPGYGTWVYSHEVPALFHMGLAAEVPVEIETPLPPLPTAPTPGAPEFAIELRVRDSASLDGATLATEQAAPAGFDVARDVVEAPRAASTAWLRAFFASDGFELDSSVVPAATTVSQPFVIERQGVDATLTVAWDPAALPQGHVVELVDGRTRVDMTTRSSYEIVAPSGAWSRELTLVIRPADGPVCIFGWNGECLVAAPFDPTAPAP